MKKKTTMIFLCLMLILTVALTGCGNDDKDMVADDNDTKTEQEKGGDSSNLNQGVVEPGDEGVVGDATDAGKAQQDQNDAGTDTDKDAKDNDKSNE